MTNSRKDGNEEAVFGFFRALREMHDLSASRLAREAGIPEDTYGDYERRKTKDLKISVLQKLLDYFGLSGAVLDQLRGKSTAADGAAVAKTVIKQHTPPALTDAERREIRQQLADAVRANPGDADARVAYSSFRFADALQEGLTPEQIARDVAIELRRLGYRAARDEEG